MQRLNEILTTVDSWIGSSDWFPFVLLGTGLFFTIYLKFPQIRYFRFAFNVVRGKYDKEGDEGDTSHFQALTTALSGTVGTGNIAGVALALHLGGPAALFWMVMTAAIGMCTKFVEVTLSHKYREKTADGSMAGGPMYYMKNAQFKIGNKSFKLGWLAAIFAGATVLSSFGTGNMPQINSIAGAVKSTFQIEPWITGAVLSVILAVVIIGGIKRIAAVTERLVPAMAVVYFIGCFSVIFANAGNIIPAISSVFTSLFTTTAATGGFLGATIAYAFNVGVGRGLFSNEAGQGSAPIAHASAKAHEPVSEGMVAILEPFIDTIIICSITGLTLLSSGAWQEKHYNDFAVTDMSIIAGADYSDDVKEDRKALKEHLSGENPLPVFDGMLQVENGKIVSDVTVIHARSVAEDVTVNEYFGGPPLTGEVEIKNGVLQDASISFYGKSLVHSSPLTAIAFTKGWFGDYGQYIVSIGLLLFAFSTAISWSYYGDRAMTFLAGSGSVKYYRVLYVAGFFVASIADTTIIWTIAAIAIALMTLPNLLGILLLRKEMKLTIKEYWDGFKKEYPQEKTPE
ncbi:MULTISPECIES: amino acid carrier protein [Roseivirga]|jgi:AGCS family alanine or glycine:cation symporter|uniref:Amino acid transporter n=1 Tax=Roseivirga thermotolerans TaxID=1758176 RepID=A0ABQ3IAA9_9BACT|nr:MULTISPECIES: amino acid carrier protein [Roseivirga]MEC7754953.1 amino acid carrier protein [Bacteroidota bacterium]GHE75440.1 amino acid transporter [Roseivirga thermotolerans]|tara:strand:+ start:21611 stop:23317 length:1707 start_codon:yes stop_codon:yes gene_type:complete